MLRIVVVPGDVIKIQEREHFVAIFLQAFDDPARCFALAESVRKTMVEAIDENPVFPQEVLFEAAIGRRIAFEFFLRKSVDVKRLGLSHLFR